MTVTDHNEQAISARHLTVNFGEAMILDDLSFEIESGKITAIIGPNGSGKTTLLKALLGLVRVKTGEIKFFNQDRHETSGLIGYVPQQFEFDRRFPITIAEFMNLSRHPHIVVNEIEKKIKEVGLTPLILNKRLGDLSGGQRQRVLIASAVLNDPAILFLDEPAAGIDVAGEAAFYDVIEHLNREHGTTVVMISHDISMISKLVDEVMCLNQRLVCSGPPRQMLTEGRLSTLYGGTATPHRHQGHNHHYGHL